MRMDTPAAPSFSQRLTIERTASAAKVRSFADEVCEGLEAMPKRLSPKWLYDDLGSALFDAICKLPEYDLTRVESALLAEHAADIVASFGDTLDLFELGSGSSIKTRYVIDAIFARQTFLNYHPIDISDDALATASLHLVNCYPALEVAAHAGDYYAVLERGILSRTHRALVMFLGSNIGNYEPAEAIRLLSAIARAIDVNDGLLIGVDLKKAPELLVAAYDDATGVTAAFIKNILGRMNRQLQANFDLRTFAHQVEYDAESGAVNSYLVSLREQTVSIPALDAAYHFAAGERVHVESSYKFSFEDLAELARVSGFSLAKTWTDPQQRFCEALLLRK